MSIPKYFTIAIEITIKAADISIFCMKLLIFISSKFLFESSFMTGNYDKTETEKLYLKTLSDENNYMFFGVENEEYHGFIEDRKSVV